MIKTLCKAMALVTLCAMATSAKGDALQDYIEKPEPAYHWKVTNVAHQNGVTIYDFQMTSLTWHSIVWQHHLQVFVPAHATYPHFCTLLNTGGDGSAEETALGTMAARQSGCPFAILFNIPNQPLFDGRTEDALVVYTWLRFLDTGDPTWPLHFPMAKAVIKAMDTIQALMKQEKQPEISGFLVTGASKRGWTAWLVGASGDPRVKAIAPMVIDVLNMPAQIPHQLAAYGALSEQVDDYTKADIPHKLQTPRGHELLQMEDPYSYRDRLTLPKLIILGTNDRYWSQDSLNLYWDGLKGPKWILYDPNSGHGLEDKARVYATLIAFVRAIAGGQKWPQMHWKYISNAKETTLEVTSMPPPVEARLWRTYAPTLDFRDSHWTFQPMAVQNNTCVGTLQTPAHGCAAMYGELVFEQDGQRFTLSTQIHILGTPEKTPQDSK